MKPAYAGDNTTAIIITATLQLVSHLLRCPRENATGAGGLSRVPMMTEMGKQHIRHQ